MVFTGGKPRDFLIEPGTFGKDPQARWRADVSEGLTGRLGAAWVQHNYVIKAQARLGALNLTMVAFQALLAEKYGVTEDDQTLRKQFNGQSWGQMDDYMFWTQELGARYLKHSKKCADWMPPAHLMGRRTGAVPSQ